MAPSSDQFFVALLRSDYIQDNLLAHVSKADICAIRQTSSACCNLVTRRLFKRVHVSFSASTFTRAARVAALARIGHHIEHLTFFLPHSDATFLPPLIHPASGAEIAFLYTPHTSMGSVMARPKYANSELADILTQQYPPLFHAATNVPSFIHALRNLVNLRHLTVRCPDQKPQERYRRCAVDYALISLRIALERAPLEQLAKISLSDVHPASFMYLRHVPGVGSVPSASRRWRQIRKLSVSVEAWDFYGASPGLDHLKIMDDYIRNMAPNLEKFSFTWLGNKGPCPISLSGDPLFAPPRASKKLFHEVTSPNSPLPTRPSRGPIHFPKLRYLQIRNSAMTAPQLRELIVSHRETVKEFDFASVCLNNNGNWDEALAPIEDDETWSRSSSSGGSDTTLPEDSFVTSPIDEYLPSPSAAVEAASQELLDIDIGRLRGSTLCDEVIDDTPLEEDLVPAPLDKRDSGVSFTTTIRKKRYRRRRRKTRSDDEDHETSSHSHSRSPSHRHKPSRPCLKPSVEILRTCSPVPNITAPILNSEPQPVLLQPKIYDPATKTSTAAAPDDGITSVQRNIEQEEAHRLMAEDAAARFSALQKAKAAVLTKLSREFCPKKHQPFSGGRVGEPSACRMLAGRDLGTQFGPHMVLEDRATMDNRSLLVPLMFSRS